MSNIKNKWGKNKVGKLDKNLDTDDDNIYTEILKDSKARGGAIRDMASGLLLLSRDLGSYFKVKVIVLDTNIILNDLSHICKKNKATTLFDEAEFGFVRLLVTPSIIDEVNEKIPKYARETHIAYEQMLMAWDIYKQKLIVLNPSKLDSQHIQRLMIRDPDDVPTAQLIELIGPELALSVDKDLIDTGYAPSKDWLPYVLSTRSAIDKEAVQIIFTAGSSAIMLGLNEGLRWIVPHLKNIIKRIPKGILGPIGIFAIALMIDPRSRKWIVTEIKKLAKPNTKNIKKTLGPIFSSLGTLFYEGAEAEKFIKDAKPHSAIPATLKGYVIRVLAHSKNSLSPTEIINNAKIHGYNPRGKDPEQYLYRILRSDPMFLKDENGRWMLAG